MKTNKETVLASDYLSSDGRMMAECLMEKDGVSIERLFNLLAQFKNDIAEIKDGLLHMDSAIDQAQYDINSHINSHD